MCSITNCANSPRSKLVSCLKSNCFPMNQKNALRFQRPIRAMKQCLQTFCGATKPQSACFQLCVDKQTAATSPSVSRIPNLNQQLVDTQWMLPIGLSTGKRDQIQLNDEDQPKTVSDWEDSALGMELDSRSKRNDVSTDDDNCGIQCRLAYAVSPRGRHCLQRECSNSRSIEALVECAALNCGAPDTSREVTEAADQNVVKKSVELLESKSKRWAERVCMETHCGHVTSNTPQYFMCGSQFCHGG